MVQTRSQTQPKPFVDATTPNQHLLLPSNNTVIFKSAPQQKTCRKRPRQNGETPSMAAATGTKKARGIRSVSRASTIQREISRDDLIDDIDKPLCTRTRSISRASTIQREICVDDLQKDSNQPISTRTRSVSRAQSVQREICEDDLIEDIDKQLHARTRSISRASMIQREISEELKKDSDQEMIMRSRSISRARSVQCVDDLIEDTDKPGRTRSILRASTIQREIYEDGLQEDTTNPVIAQLQTRTPPPPEATTDIQQENSSSGMTTPENAHTLDEMKEAAIQHSSTIQQHPPPHHHHSYYYPYSDTPKSSLERVPYPVWGHQYYDLQDHSLPEYPASANYNPMFLRSDWLYDKNMKRIYEDEESNESILPTPTSSLESSPATTSEEEEKESKLEGSMEKKKEPSFFWKYCSIL